ncbi:DUF2752 domain-containing protein [Arenimonas fontis]|nr:DUF2752 domain-containing protein [Arenimonas fontis]
MLLTIVAGALLLRQADPNAPGSLLPPCAFEWLTGLYCPGCGATRALHALAHGDPARALAMNPLLVLSLPAIALMLARVAGWLPASWQPLTWRLSDARPWAVVIIAYAITRNLPWAPFSWLAPGGIH